MANLSRACERSSPSLSAALLSRHSRWFIFLHYAQLSGVLCLAAQSLASFPRSFFVSELTISWSRTLTHATCWAGMFDRGSPTGRHRISNALRSLEEQQLWLTFHPNIRSFYIYTLNIYTLISIYIYIYICIYIYKHTHVPYIFGLPVEARAQPDSSRWVRIG